MFDESGYRCGTGGSAHKQGWTAAQPARVSQRSGNDRLLESGDKAQVFVIGVNGSTLAVANSLRPDERGEVIARLLPLAWTPVGVAVGDRRQDVGIPLSGLLDWIDRSFPEDDDRAVVASIHDLELLARIGWNAPLPKSLDHNSLLNGDDVPQEVTDALARPAVALVACAACRRLCVRGDFRWKEKELCAWDYHGQVFGKRGPWRDGRYEAHHFQTLPSCAYVAPEIADEVGVEILMTVGELADSPMAALVNLLLEFDPVRSHMAVKTASGVVVLREKPALSPSKGD